MAPPACIESERLLLRPFRSDDAPQVQRLAGAPEIAAAVLGIPHPYPDGVAEEWIERQAADPALHHFAITLRDSGSLIGAIGLDVEDPHDRAELGYWIGVPYWGNGYATEAAQMVVGYAFDTLQLHRVYAFHFANNRRPGRAAQDRNDARGDAARSHAQRGRPSRQ